MKPKAPLFEYRKALLEALYAQYNRGAAARNDPVHLLYRYGDWRDREIAGLVASSLALGNVKQIIASVESVLRRMGPSPADYLDHASRGALRKEFARFRHRFITGEELASMLFGVTCAVRKYGSVNACFSAGLRPNDETILPALSAFAKELRSAWQGSENRLLSVPEKGSACKRLNLFLRWMARRDAVDPGGWDNVPAAKLIMPLDTHIDRICRALGLTQRQQPNLRAALEITAAFRTIAPDDPVRYDFALAHLGIDGGENLAMFLKQWSGPGCGAGWQPA
jgi:uncharacterized protein (TIGR02757 family)